MSGATVKNIKVDVDAPDRLGGYHGLRPEPRPAGVRRVLPASRRVEGATVRSIKVDMSSTDRLGGVFTYHGEPFPDGYERLNVRGSVLSNWPTPEECPQDIPEEQKEAMRSAHAASGLGFCSRCAAYNSVLIGRSKRLDVLALSWLWDIPVADSLRLIPECHVAPWDGQCRRVKEDKQRRRDEAEAQKVADRRSALKAAGKGGRPPKHADHAARQRDYRKRVSSRCPRSIRTSTLKVHSKVFRLDDEPITYKVERGVLDGERRGMFLTDAPKSKGLLLQTLQTVEYTNDDEHDND